MELFEIDYYRQQLRVPLRVEKFQDHLRTNGPWQFNIRNRIGLATLLTRIISGLFILYNAFLIYWHDLRPVDNLVCRAAGLMAGLFIWRRGIGLSNLHARIFAIERMILTNEPRYQEGNIAELVEQVSTEWAAIKWWWW